MLMFRYGPKRPGTTFYCFSPMVMATTFLIEFTLAAYVFLRYRLNRSGQIIVAILTCLATFQLAEYIICTSPALTTNGVARAGFVAITMLPPLGLHLVSTIAKSGQTAVTAGYGMAAVISSYLIITPGILATVCGHNYVMFDMPSPFNYVYGTFYYGVIAVSLFVAARYINKKGSLKSHEALRWFITGILAFIIPTFATNVLRPETREAIPSIMCGFAVVFALILAFRVVPQVAPEKQIAKLRFWS